MTPLLAGHDISKRFASNRVVAVDHATLEVGAGEIHALIGENGAGKSTLMQIVAGVLAPDEGEVSFSGARLPPGRTTAARSAGIVMSYQHPRLDRELSVAENLFLGDEPVRFGIFDRRRARLLAERAAPGFDTDLLDHRLGSLSSGRVRMVSIVAALLRLPQDRNGVLILDEPTAAATPAEIETLFEIIRANADRGHAVVFISHRLPEVERIASAATVMRHGRTTTVRGTLDARSLAHLMVGDADLADASVTFSAARGRSQDGHAAASPPTGEPRIILDSVTVSRAGTQRLRDVSLTVHAGEILGATGIRENGIEALEDLVGGMARPTAGRYTICGHDAGDLAPDRLRRMGLRYVPTDRLLRGASLESSVADNLIAVRRWELQRAGFFDRDEVGEFATGLRDGFGIESGVSLPLWQLSGGNIQKVILSRELEGNPRAVVICEPSWGLDFRARALIVERIRRAARDGAAILLLTTDIDEVIDLADRCVVFYDGAVIARYDRATATREELGRALAGSPGPAAARA